MRGTGVRTGAIVSSTSCAKEMRSGRKTKQQQQVVQWKHRNVQEGIVIVDELQLSKLIKRDPIQKFYDLDPEPFARGQFASVSRCRSRDTGQQFAAKFSSRTRYGDDCSAEIHHEIALLSLCSPSSRVIRLHDVFETPTEIILVLEFAPGGDLQTIIDDNLVPFEADVVKFVRQLVEGLAYLHDRKIAHLDIKPQNLVMMADFPHCDVKLCDFEISRVILEGTEIREILGTPDYVAPEVLHYEPITLKADMWSLGVTTYVLLTGFSPFGGETDQETFCNISRAEVDFPEELFEDVSEEAQDFIRSLLVRDPGARPTAKECLHHKWLSKKISRTSTPPSLLRHDSSLLVGKTSRTATPSDDLTEMSPRSVTQHKNLRKYLSKSREALFERVVQQQQQHHSNSLRKTTILSQYHKTRRLCESQMSLVSKSRERLLMTDQHQMSPYFSRSREKLYGLRSLSKSHEVLNLCKSAATSGGQTPQGVGLGILKTLTRATTADLSMIPLLRQRLMSHGSSTTSISSSVATEHDTDELAVPLSPSEHTKPSSLCSAPGSVIPSPVTPAPLEQPRENSSESPNGERKSPTEHTTAEHPLQDIKIESITQIPALLSPKLLKETIKNQSSFEKFSNSEQSVCEATDMPHEKQRDLKTPEATGLLNEQTDIADTCAHETTKYGLDSTQLQCSSNYQSDKTSEDDQSNQERCTFDFEAKSKSICTPQDILWKEQDIHSNSKSVVEIEDEKRNDSEKVKKKCEDGTEQESEPRYTVAQLVSAFNRHQEVVTKTSLEVTMTTSDKETKIPPIIFNMGNSKFPTGPNALRLFIPDIDITNGPPKRKQKRKYAVGLRFPSETARNTDVDQTSKETIESSKDTSQTEDDESFQSLESSSSLATSDYDALTNSSVPEDYINKAENEKLIEKIMTTESEEAKTEVDFRDENTDNTNNNNQIDDSSAICTVVVESTPGEKVPNAEPYESQHDVNVNKFRLSVEVTPNYLRSGSHSSDTSAASSEVSSSMSWEELTPPSTATPTSNDESQQWPQKQAGNLSLGQRQASRSRSPSVNRESWGRICTGTYNRAMEKFNSKVSKQENTVPTDANRRPDRKSLTLLSPPQMNSDTEKVRRKSIPVIRQFL